MSVVRKTFLVLSILVPIVSLGGIIVLTVMEYHARAGLPPEQQTAEIIASVYDGAVCLGCDFGRVFFAMFGTLSFLIILSGWGIYELGRRVLIHMATPE